MPNSSQVGLRAQRVPRNVARVLRRLPAAGPTASAVASVGVLPGYHARRDIHSRHRVLTPTNPQHAPDLPRARRRAVHLRAAG
jgi:hypothetical protein